MQRVFGNFRRGISAAGKKQLPVRVFLCQVFGIRKIAIDYIVSGLIRITECHFVFRLVNIHVITVLLIYPDIVNDKLGIFPKHIVIVRITYPAAADSQIQYHVKRLVIWCGIRDFPESRFLCKPVIHCIEQHVIHIKAKLTRIPFAGEYVE